MISQPYVDGITGTVTHAIASSLTAVQIAAGEDTLSIAVVCPDRWFPGDVGVVTSRDGHPFVGQVADMDVCTGEITIKLSGSQARELPLRGRRGGVSAGGALTASSVITGHRHISLYQAGPSSNCTRQSRELWS